MDENQGGDQPAEQESDDVGTELGSIVATFDFKVTLRNHGAAPGSPPSSGDMERIATEALTSYKAAFGVDTIRVRAVRTDG